MNLAGGFQQTLEKACLLYPTRVGMNPNGMADTLIQRGLHLPYVSGDDPLTWLSLNLHTVITLREWG